MSDCGWVVCDSTDQTFKCLRCFEKEAMKVPAPVTDFAAQGETFGKKHKGCKVPYKKGDVIVPAGETYPHGALVVDEFTLHAELTAYPKGGGFQLKFPRTAVEKYRFRVVSQEEQKTPYKEGRFVIDCWEKKTFEGYSAAGERWNGWAMPVFPRLTGVKICKCLNQDYKKKESRSRYDPNQDAFLIWDETEQKLQTVKGESIQVGQETVRVYAIGTGDWTWSKKEKKSHDDAP